MALKEDIVHICEAQIISYLKATGLEVGLLINLGKCVEIKRKYVRNMSSLNNERSKKMFRFHDLYTIWNH